MEAAKFINSQKDAIFAKATGEGNDLPYGCIFYTKWSFEAGVLVSTRRYIFWNPKGGLPSLDRDVRQVCYESQNSFSGIQVQWIW